MKRFRVSAVMSSSLTCEIEAESVEEAWEIAYETDGSDFTVLPFSDSWELYDMTEIKENKHD